MRSSVWRGLGSVVLGAALLAVIGCGGPPRGTVSGKVTLDGQPLKSGYIDFIPEDTKGGQTAGGKISQGSYVVKDVSPGRMRVSVHVSATDTKDMQQLGKELRKWQHTKARKMQKPPVEVGVNLQPGSPGTGEIHDIRIGRQVLDLELTTAK